MAEGAVSAASDRETVRRMEVNIQKVVDWEVLEGVSALRDGRGLAAEDPPPTSLWESRPAHDRFQIWTIVKG